VLAALFLASVPALAQADSVEKQYEVELPNAGIPEKPKKDKTSAKEPEATASHGEPQTGPSEANVGEKDSEGEDEKQGAAAGKGGNNGGGNNPGNQNGSPGGGNSNSAQGTGSLSQSEAVPGTESGEQVSHSSGSSSPLVPILIAVAVLAAISIGAVIYRQRRQDSGGSGSAVSPNA
jgi:cobalamin biosynthesis Mg chelatase CobN